MEVGRAVFEPHGTRVSRLFGVEHFQRYHIDFILAGVNMSLEGDVVSFVPFDGIGVGDGPGLAVLIAHEGLPIVADRAHDGAGLHGGVGACAALLHGVLARVLGNHANRRQQTQGKQHRAEFSHFVLLQTCGFIKWRAVVRVGMPSGPALTHDCPNVTLALHQHSSGPGLLRQYRERRSAPENGRDVCESKKNG